MQRSYYEILGVMPNAEDIVITAAYRALANRYHPDKNIADPVGTASRMAEVNVAYETLSDPVKRKRYDETINASQMERRVADEETAAAFSDALSELESKWGIATKVFPDLTFLKSRLDKIGTSLSFSFVSYLLETKDFDRRHFIAKSLEEKYFQTYFGDDKRIVEFAKELIELNMRQALLALNSYLEVLGSDIDPQPIIDTISMEHGVYQKRKEKWAENDDKSKADAYQEQLGTLYEDVLHHGYFDSAIKILTLKGFGYNTMKNGSSGGFFAFGKPPSYVITKDGKVVAENLDIDGVLKWVTENLI